MKKLGNKGFAISSVVYSILVLFVILVTAVLAMLSGRKVILDKSKSGIMEKIDEMEEPDKYGTDDYTQNGLVLHYDGIQNTRSGPRNTSATKWQNLASSTGQYDGTLTGFASNAWADGKGLSFDGVNDFVNVGSFGVTESGVTIEIVVKYSDIARTSTLVGNLDGGGYALEHQFDPYLEWAYHANYANHTLSFYNTKVNAVQSLASSNETKSNHIYSITSIIDLSEKKIHLYENGEEFQAMSTNLELKAPNNSTLLGIGAKMSGNSAVGQYLKGTVYSVRVYDRPLDTVEVLKNYSVDRKRFGVVE